MRNTLQYAPQALSDLEETLSFLSDIHVELPRKFRNELFIHLTELDEHPERWSVLANSIRAIRIRLSKKLAYYVFYKFYEQEEKIIVLRVLSQYASQSKWPE